MLEGSSAGGSTPSDGSWARKLTVRLPSPFLPAPETWHTRLRPVRSEIPVLRGVILIPARELHGRPALPAPHTNRPECLRHLLYGKLLIR